MPIIDRFTIGSTAQSPQESFDECMIDDCQKQIFTGDKVWKLGPDLLCSGACLTKALRAGRKQTRYAGTCI